MLTQTLTRTLAAGLLAFSGLRNGHRWTSLAGLALAVLLFGLQPQPFPGPAEAAFLAGASLVVAGLLYFSVWAPLVSEAARSGAALSIPVALVAMAVLREHPRGTALAGSATVLAVMGLFAAAASWANAEAGWRRGLGWAGAVCLPVLEAWALATWVHSTPASAHHVTALAGAFAALLAWGPALGAEWSRTKRELAEEVKLGFLPEADAAVLRVPWRRMIEKRFGRPDERREYIRSALQLAVARGQQRRRSGETLRLHQLEILTFRTRLRRMVEAKSARLQPRGAEEDLV